MISILKNSSLEFRGEFFIQKTKRRVKNPKSRQKGPLIPSFIGIKDYLSVEISDNLKENNSNTY